MPPRLLIADDMFSAVNEADALACMRAISDVCASVICLLQSFVCRPCTVDQVASSGSGYGPEQHVPACMQCLSSMSLSLEGAPPR